MLVMLPPRLAVSWTSLSSKPACDISLSSSVSSVDEVAAAYSVAFDPAGERLYAGLDGCLSVFDVSRPGRQIETRKMKG